MSKNILLVEDNRLIAFGLQEELQSFGYLVTKAHCGSEAIQYAKANIPNLILMDINLGEQINGIEVMHIIHKEIGFIPNIYITGYADNEISKQAESTSPFVIMDKPIHILQLTKAITNCLNSLK